MLFIQIFFVFPLNPLLLLPSNLFRNNKPASYEEGGLKYIYEEGGGHLVPIARWFICMCTQKRALLDDEIPR